MFQVLICKMIPVIYVNGFTNIYLLSTCYGPGLGKAQDTLVMGEVGIKRKMERVNLIKIYCKHLHKCHNVPPVQL
jgi:hypothetical protein